jgi:hypothetical protein
MTVIARWYVCENCGRVGPMADLQDECRPGWTHGRLLDVDPESPALATARGAVEEAYARGIAAAMDVIRAHDFPFTERVDLIAERLAPTVTRGQSDG